MFRGGEEGSIIGGGMGRWGGEGFGFGGRVKRGIEKWRVGEVMVKMVFGDWW